PTSSRRRSTRRRPTSLPPSPRSSTNRPRSSVLDVCAGTLDLGLLVEDRGLGGSEVGLRLVDLRLEDVGVDARDDLALLHDRVEVDEELFDLPRNLAADLDGDDRVEVAGRRDGSGEGTTLDARQPVLGCVPDG